MTRPQGNDTDVGRTGVTAQCEAVIGAFVFGTQYCGAVPVHLVACADRRCFAVMFTQRGHVHGLCAEHRAAVPGEGRRRAG